MDTKGILELLISERDRLNLAIAALKGGKTGVGRGRKTGQEDGVSKSKGRARSGGHPRTQEQRAAQSEKMRAYWAAKKQSSKKK